MRKEVLEAIKEFQQEMQCVLDDNYPDTIDNLVADLCDRDDLQLTQDELEYVEENWWKYDTKRHT